MEPRSLQARGELLTADFRRRMQALHRAGEVIDIFPCRLRGTDRAGASWRRVAFMVSS